MPTNTHIHEIVTFCYNYICYSGKYSPHHPRIPPGIVYGLSAGIAEKMPLVVYNSNSTPSLASHSYSIFYWLSHYSSVFAMLLLGSTYFRCLFLSTHYVSRSNEEEKASDEPSKTEERYQERYYEKYDVIKQKEKDQEAETTSSLATNNTSTHSSLNRVIDYTGQYGNIMMYYNTESDSFDYFSDNKSIPFNYLETVSRKLGISFHCTDKLIDRRNVLKQNNEEYSIEKEKGRDNTGAKVYHKEDTPDASHTSTSSKVRRHKDPRHLANIVKAKANKFIYVGKFSSMNPLQTIRYDEACISKKSIRSKLSYTEYMDSLQYS